MAEGPDAPRSLNLTPKWGIPNNLERRPKVEDASTPFGLRSNNTKTKPDEKANGNLNAHVQLLIKFINLFVVLQRSMKIYGLTIPYP